MLTLLTLLMSKQKERNKFLNVFVIGFDLPTPRPIFWTMSKPKQILFGVCFPKAGYGSIFF